MTPACRQGRAASMILLAFPEYQILLTQHNLNKQQNEKNILLSPDTYRLYVYKQL